MRRKVQKISSYFAVFDPANEGGFDVSFPDFSGYDLEKYRVWNYCACLPAWQIKADLYRNAQSNYQAIQNPTGKI